MGILCSKECFSDNSCENSSDKPFTIYPYVIEFNSANENLEENIKKISSGLIQL